MIDPSERLSRSAQSGDGGESGFTTVDRGASSDTLEIFLMSDRRFQLWEYHVSHGNLLIRSPKGPQENADIDIVFNGVELVCCPRFMRGIELVSANESDIAMALTKIGEIEPEDHVFVLLSEGVRNIVVASSLRIAQHCSDIFDSPF